MIWLLSGEAHWLSFLQSEGLPYRLVGNMPTWPGKGVLILDRPPNDDELRLLDAHIKTGGGVLAGSRCASLLLGSNQTVRVRVRYIRPDDSALFTGTGIIDTDCVLELPRSANHGLTNAGARAVYSGSIGSAPIVVLCFEPSGLLGDTRSANRRFSVPGGRAAFERVSAVAKAELKRLLANCLRVVLARLGLPYVRLSPFPAGTRALFGMRIDTDVAGLDSILTTAEIADALGVKLSFFVHTAASMLNSATLQRLTQSGHEVSLHCYRHGLPRRGEAIRGDLNAGVAHLSRLGVRPPGYAAPFGEWTAELQTAVAEAGFDYSSEFACSYDGLPFHPVIGSLQQPLQLPVHPVCSGTLRRARADESTLIGYYRRLIEHRLARREPCLLYDHPPEGAGQESVFRRLLELARATGGRFWTFVEYARWWRSREVYCTRFEVTSDSVLIDNSGNEPLPGLIAEFDGREAWIDNVVHSFRLAELNWQPQPKIAPGPRTDPALRRATLIQLGREIRLDVKRCLQKRRSGR